MEYGINKGIGKSVEFRGLKAQYLFIFAGGLLAVFVVFVILYMAGVDQWVCIAFGVAAASVLVWLTFRLNTRYGEHGLMKLLAARQPSHIARNAMMTTAATITAKSMRLIESPLALPQRPREHSRARHHRA